MHRLTLDQVMERVRNLPALPAVVIELLALFNHGDADPDEISIRINRDQALTAKLLQVANSSFYGLPTKVAIPREAITILGLHNVHTLVMASTLTSSLPAFQAGWFAPEVFWKHSLSVASCARLLAGRANLNGDIAFTAGLMHDIGRLALVACFPAQYQLVMEHHQSEGCGLLEAEQRLLDFDHTDVGAALAGRWKFAGAIQEAVAGHHRRDIAIASLSGLIFAGDAIVQALDPAGEPNSSMAPLNDAQWARLGLAAAEIGPLLDEIEAQCRATSATLIA